MTEPISLLAAPFVPTTSLAGSEPTRLFRGQNIVVKALGDMARLETFPGVRSLSENYEIDAWTLTGTVIWTANSTTVTITGGAALSELRPGQMFIAGAEVFVVNRVVSDTSIIVERAPTTTDAVGTTGHFMPTLFEVDNRRGVLRRGNAIAIDRRDLLFVGQGNLYLNGTDTTFAASRRPQRLQRATDGTYTLVPFGFPNAPPRPVFTVGFGAGQKNMQAGKYSFMASYWNSVTGGFSNPSDLVKTETGGAELTITAGGFFNCDVTDIIAAKPTNADGVIIWGSLSGGGVADINASNFNQGAWYEVARVQFTAKTVTAVDTGADTITIPNHKFRNGDYLVYTRTGGTTDIGGLTSGTRYYVIVVDANTIKVAAIIANYRANTALDLTAAGDGTRTFGALASGDVFPVEYLDAEVGNIASGDNDRPPECEWIANFANTPFYISCFGRITAANPFGESFGNFVLSAKQSNIEAAPTAWRVSLGAEITGFASGVGRLFCLTRNGIPFVTPTGRTELSRLSPTLLDFPFTARPFATKGGISPYNLMLVQNDLYMFTGGMPLRSPSMIDEKASPFELGRAIEDVILTWKDGYTFVAHDPQNRHVCFVGSAVRKNTAGYWESEVYPLDLSGQVPMWQPKILLTSPTRDMIVSGVAVVDNRFEFLCGGRRAATTRRVDTFRYYESDGSAIPYYIVFQPTDLGEELRSKMMRSIRVTGRVNSLTAQVHGAAPGGTISIANIEAGTNSLSGDIAIGSSSGLQRMFRTKYLVKNLGLAALRIAGTWPGTGDPDRIDEVVIEVGTHGRKV